MKAFPLRNSSLRLLKNTVKHGLRRVVHALPRGAQLAVLEQVTDDLGPWMAMNRVAPRCGVETLSVTGSEGLIEGASTDSIVLAGYARHGTWAKRTNDLLRAFFSEHGGDYVDIGANIGLTTIPAARNPNVSCLAIEPDPTNFRCLDANVRRHCQHGNVQLRQLAIFSHAARLSLELAPDNMGDHRLRTGSIHGQQEERWKTVEVDTVALDELAPLSGRPLAVKIDTQGAEPFVFAGGSQTLAGASLIIAEWAPYWLARLGGEPGIVTSFLESSFAYLIIAEGEEGPINEPLPVKVATERLLEMAFRHRNDPYCYADIIARR